MALFGAPNAFLGLDIGTSSLKLVELVRRRKGAELATYAQANVPNLLVNSERGKEEDAIRQVANVVSRMMDAAKVSTDVVVAALPSSIVFSTVLTLPSIPPAEMDKAVHFAARDVVPADLDEMVLGWSQLGQPPHMDTDDQPKSAPAPAAGEAKQGHPLNATQSTVPVFVTAAPKDVVQRYLRVMDILKLQLQTLEVETFPLVRSLFSHEQATGLIADIGDKATTFHVIDAGTPRVSHTIDFGGYDITLKIAEMTNITEEEAESAKVKYGLSPDAPDNIRVACQHAVNTIMAKGKSLIEVYTSRQGRKIPKTILIGGGASMKELPAVWSKYFGHPTSVGNPWKGLSYAQALEQKLQLLGPTYGVAVGLAMRGLSDIE